MEKPLTSKDKWIISIIVAMIFLIVASPYLFRITNGILGGRISDSRGFPTVTGLLVHGMIFLLIIRAMMR
jgi:hypothetical protein